MATLAPYTLQQKGDAGGILRDVLLLPIAADNGKQALSTAVRFGTFTAGDAVIVSSTAAFHCIAGTVSVTATTSHPLFPAGVYRFWIPDACTHVSMIDSAAGAGSGQAYAG